MSQVIRLVLAWVSLAYVNGGTYHHTLQKHRDQLRAQGWAVCTSQDEVRRPESRKQESPSQLIGRTVQQLPEEVRDKVAPQTKRELAKIAAKAFKTGQDKKEQNIVEGRTGDVRYRLGTFAYESYWETDYREGSKEKVRTIHELRKGLGEFVALRVAAEDEDDP